MRFSLSATTALLLQVSTTAEAASSSSSTFLDAFEFGRSPPIQRKRKNHRGLVIQTESTRRMTKSSKADSVSSLPSFDGSSSSDAKASKKGDGYRLMPKATKQAKIAKQAKAFSTDTLGSIFMEPPRTAKADKITTDMSYSFANLDFSMLTSEFSMPVPSTPPPTSFPSKGSGGNGGGGDTGDDSGGDSGGASPSPTPRHHQPNNFHEVIFKYLSVCTGVELEMDCLTSTTIDALSTMHGGEATRARARRFLGTEITMEPTPSNVRVTRSPTVSEVTPSPTQAPPTPFPTPFPTSTATMIPTSPPTDQCRPEVNEADLLSILTTSKQECIDSGSPISDETFQSTLSSFLAIFDKSNTCWDSLCGDSDPTSDLFFKILFDQASECANVVLTVEECILDHILEVVFHSVASEESGRRVRRSLQDSCCEPTESDLNFYASYLLLSADAACAEKGSVEISTDEWNKATEDLVKLFGARECWGVEPCEEEGDGVVGQEVPTPSPTDNNGAISAISGDSEDVLPYYDGPILSEDGEVCTLTTDSYAPEAVRSLELSFYYQVETTSDSLDLGLIERALIALVCDDAGNERRLNELETEVIAVDASPGDVISDECEYLSSWIACLHTLDLISHFLLHSFLRLMCPLQPRSKLPSDQRSRHHPPCWPHHPQRRNLLFDQNRLPLPHCLGQQ